MNILNYFKDCDISFDDKLFVLEALHNAPVNDWQLDALLHKVDKKVKQGDVLEDLGCYAGIYWKPLIFKKEGLKIATHKHDFPHVTFIVKGSISINGKHYHSGNMVVVPEGVDHSLVALENDSLAFCISTVQHSMKGSLSKEDAMFYNQESNPYLDVETLAK